MATWLRGHMRHIASIYGFFAVLGGCQAATRATSVLVGDGSACERRYRIGEQWHNLRPDALAEFHAGSQQFRFWLEWDRGTMNARDLAVKFASYSHDVALHEWAREGAKPP